jgi:hypothetical protein
VWRVDAALEPSSSSGSRVDAGPARPDRALSAYTTTYWPIAAIRCDAAAARAARARRGRSVPGNLFGSALHASEKSQ